MKTTFQKRCYLTPSPAALTDRTPPAAIIDRPDRRIAPLPERPEIRPDKTPQSQEAHVNLYLNYSNMIEI
jgi:hypothetical protein